MRWLTCLTGFHAIGPCQVETGPAPSAQNLSLTKVDATSGTVTLARPMCKYPAYPRYNGTGDPNVAGSFTCSTQ